MPDPALDQQVRSFFDAFAAASEELDTATLGGLFADPFLAADPAGAQPVPRELFLKALPRRAELFGAAGIGRVVLDDVAHEVLDDTYVLARTTWRAERAAAGGGEPAPVRLASTFLLRRESDGLRVVLYLNHQDLAKVLSSG
jgi:ketosteroid isomerase-like protein